MEGGGQPIYLCTNANETEGEKDEVKFHSQKQKLEDSLW